MSDSLTYVLSLNDQISSKLQKIGVSSDNALNKFSKLQDQASKTKQLLTDMGGSVGSLRAKLELLKAEKEWIPASNLSSIRKYNTEIKNLEKEILRLDTINGSVFKRNLKDAISNIPFSNLLTNPISLASTAIFTFGKASMNFEEGMSQINTTAQLSQSNLKALGKDLRSIGVDAGADLTTVPQTFEKINSQLDDVALSTDVLKYALKGSKAGFTDQTIVAEALANTLSSVGKENTTAKEVLDTFFAAKRVGGAEFKDLAQYMPGLIASGKSLGVAYQETAGAFAYMTAKGVTASDAAVLMQNTYSALSKIDIQKNLAAAGLDIFDKNRNVKSLEEIFKSLAVKMKTLKGDEAKSNFLANVGIVDSQARMGIINLTSDTTKLSESMKAVSDSSGEADEALGNSANNKQKLAQMWSKIQNLSISLGGAISSILIPAFDILSLVLVPVLDSAAWLIDLMQEHSTATMILAGALGSLYIANNYIAIGFKLSSAATVIYSTVTKAAAFASGIFTGATKILSAALSATPFGAVILLLGGLAAAAMAVGNAFSYSSLHAQINAEITKEANMRMIDERVELDRLFSSLRNTLPGTQERSRLISEMNQKYPGLLDNYDLEIAKNKELDQIQKKVNANLFKKITRELQIEKGKSLLKEAEEMKDMYAGIFGWGNKQKWKEIREMQAEAKRLFAEPIEVKLEATWSKMPWNTGIFKNLGKNPLDEQIEKKEKIIDLLDTEEKINNRIQELQQFKGNEKIGSKKYTTYIAEIERLQKMLNPTSRGGTTAKTGSKTNEAIATGGTKSTVINFQFKNIVETVRVTGKDFRESADKMAEQTGDALLRTLAMAATTAG